MAEPQEGKKKIMEARERRRSWKEGRAMAPTTGAALGAEHRGGKNNDIEEMDSKEEA